MTKKDYIALARAISTLPDATRSQACAVVGMVLRIDNPLFDMERFAKACGVSSEPVPVRKPSKWVIRSHSMTDHETGESLFWSNDEGWVDRASATEFSDSDKRVITTIKHMPLGASGWESTP